MADAQAQLITLTRGIQFLADISPETPVNITGWTLRFRIFRVVGSAALITCIAGDGLSVTDPDNGVVRIYLTPDQTEGLAVGTYLWDLERTDVGYELQHAGGTVNVENQDGSLPPVSELICPPPVYTAAYGKVFSKELKPQRPAVAIPSGSPSAVKLSLFTHDSRPAIVSEDGYCGSVEMQAAFGESVYAEPILAAVELTDSGTTATVELPEAIYGCPGIYDLDVRAVDAGGATRAQSRALIYVEPSTLGGWQQGPPRIDEIRSAIRDYPGANRLLGTYEFSVVEVAQAVAQAVRRFNGAPPMTTGRVRTTTWPRDYWAQLIDAVLGELFEIAAAYHRRGHLPYSAAGVAVDDLAKEKDYLQAAMFHRQRWDWWVKMIKTSINLEESFGSLATNYAWM